MSTASGSVPVYVSVTYGTNSISAMLRSVYAGRSVVIGDRRLATCYPFYVSIGRVAGKRTLRYRIAKP
jgi:hypothetical protein